MTNLLRRYLRLFCLLIILPCFHTNYITAAHLDTSVNKLPSLPIRDCRSTDSLNLIILYQALNGPNWKAGWDFNTPLEEWKGIGLNEASCVSSITLNNNNLSGVLPDEIGDFTALKRLSLGNNQLSGNLPATINQLQLLESLNLRSNELSGAIPANLSDLKRLTTLNLSVNQLTGNIPLTIGDLTALTGLFLNQNKLTGPVPIFLDKLEQLVSLNLASNELKGSIPSTIGLLANLTGIGLNNNQLTGELPLSLSFLSNLVSLRLENNQLSGSIPSEYGELSRIETIFLFNNNLSGCYSQSLSIFCPLGEGDFGRGYNFTNNPKLPWQGNFTNFCEGSAQRGASCTNGMDSTLVEVIGTNCACVEQVAAPMSEPLSISESIQVSGTCPTKSDGIIEWNSTSSTTYTINWTSPDNTSTRLSQQTNLLLQNLQNGTHLLTFIDENNPDIVLTQQVEVPIRSCIEQGQIPQAITPNGDGFNDRFIFDDLENNPSAFPDNELLIFNRWGDILYTAKPYYNDWAGTNNSGRSVPEGTYYYILKLDLNQGLLFRGSVTVIR